MSLNKKYEDFLDRKCAVSGLENYTWRWWFKDILLLLYKEVECFSGKRPHGNSGWQWELELDIAIHLGIAKVKYDECGYVEDAEFDDKQTDKFYEDLLNYFFYSKNNGDKND